MSPNDMRDPLLAALRELRTHDVRPVRAHRLRARCHRQFEMQGASKDLQRSPMAAMSTRVASAVAGAWCVVYLLETIRRAAAVFRF